MDNISAFLALQSNSQTKVSIFIAEGLVRAVEVERERRREEMTRLRLVDSRLREELENHRRSDQRHLQTSRYGEIIN